MGAMLSSPWAVSGVFLLPMESQAFEVYSFSAFRFDFYTLLLYCVCNNCESFKSNKKNITYINTNLLLGKHLNDRYFHDVIKQRYTTL